MEDGCATAVPLLARGVDAEVGKAGAVAGDDPGAEFPRAGRSPAALPWNSPFHSVTFNWPEHSPADSPAATATGGIST